MGRYAGATRLLIVDTSAVIALFRGEATTDRLLERLVASEVREISAANAIEAGTVVAGTLQKRGEAVEGALDELAGLLAFMKVDVVAVTPEHVELALQARFRFGRSFGGPGKLNFGDCFAYALARSRDAPLLYVGNDFAQTDIVSALA